MKTVRAALWPVLERAKAEISPDMMPMLFGQLASLGKDKTMAMLELWRPLGLHLARTSSARERKKFIEQIGAEQPYWPLYATVAWTARTLALTEYLERADLAAQPKKWAGDQALLLMDDFYEDDAWLWPFDGEVPWEETDDDE
ncbi:hypothetical protein [Novosphingobium sp. CECT 9465]|uniref:hypothetical protein n=1 Tax=Novosphingobium sp. CECT 9465 TaxID=2829794 RepID=UPI001E53DE75|nr:hypothetical protein [Novosphingobium sp. CECT 9465]CAH0498165.1 hypothetical protein NVSP9465_03241 [Novosphingobium sp. CECT 9465]